MVISILSRAGDAPGYGLRLRAQLLAFEPNLDVRLDGSTACDVLIVVVGPAWQQAAPPAGVVESIAEAFRSTRRVIPVLVQGGQMPAAATLPPRLAEFAVTHAHTLRGEAFPASVRALLTEIHEADASGPWRGGGATGRLHITSIRPAMLTRLFSALDPEQPVNVRIDGTTHGSLHLFGDEKTFSVPPGRHEVLLRSRWEEPFEVDVPSDGTLVVTVSRNPVTGGVTVVKQTRQP